jgi:tRNA pseudouridine38-40 synthase
MPRYFVEVSYKGTSFSGFQVQEVVRTVQGEIERVLAVYVRESIALTGSSRTDGGVHARQNFFHFDWNKEMEGDWVYHLNAMLPEDLAIRGIYRVPDEAHCRFDAVSREYVYTIYRRKDPFREGWGWRYPYPLEGKLLQQAAQLVEGEHNFSSFCKRGVQVKNFICRVEASVWEGDGEQLEYRVRANRFLRGMVRSLVGAMVRVGRGQLSMKEWVDLLEGRADGAVRWLAPAEGLVLQRVSYGGDLARIIEGEETGVGNVNKSSID